MIDTIRNLLFGKDDANIRDSVDQQQAVTVALLVKAALMDGDFQDSERKVIINILYNEFSLSAEEIDKLICDAEAAVSNSSQLFGFTRIVDQHFSKEKRLVLLEMLWRVICADGVIHDYESNLMRRITGLLHLTDRENAYARQSVIRNKENKDSHAL